MRASQTVRAEFVPNHSITSDQLFIAIFAMVFNWQVKLPTTIIHVQETAKFHVHKIHFLI